MLYQYNIFQVPIMDVVGRNITIMCLPTPDPSFSPNSSTVEDELSLHC